MRMPPWKYIESPGIGLVELYDLGADADEMTDVSRSHAEIIAELAGMLQGWKDSTERREVEPAEMSPEALEALRALGYIQ